MLPALIEWRLSTFRHPVFGEQPIIMRSITGVVADLALARDNNGGMGQHAVCGMDALGRCRVPPGASGWRIEPNGAWQDLATLPAEWRLVE